LDDADGAAALLDRRGHDLEPRRAMNEQLFKRVTFRPDKRLYRGAFLDMDESLELKLSLLICLGLSGLYVVYELLAEPSG
jgi:hypothetical protein